MENKYQLCPTKNLICDVCNGEKIISTYMPKMEDLIKKIEEIKILLSEKQKTKDIFLDNQEFLQIMNISKRTAQNWRDDGIIPYSQIGSKIYYRMTDIQELLNNSKIIKTKINN